MALGQAAFVFVVTEAADGADRSVLLAARDGGHGDAVEPVLLDHRVSGRILDADPVADLQGPVKARLSEDVACQTGLTRDLVPVVALLR